jgi:fermentation-respiration switch protein FrsA (DUF1100 family)
VDGAERAMVIGTPQAITASSTEIDREFYDYYRTPRGHHPRSTTAMSRTSDAALTLFSAFDRLGWISPRPVLFITGDVSHSRIFSEQAYARAAEPRELYVVPGAGHGGPVRPREPDPVGQAHVVLHPASAVSGNLHG